MQRVRFSALALVCAAGCSGNVHTLELTLTSPDGTTEKHSLSGETSWEYGSSGKPFASWPDLANWGTSEQLGVSVDLYPMQPGTYETSGLLYLGGDFREAKQATITMHMERVVWQGSRSFPFRQEGRLEGTTADGYSFTGTFTTSTDDCTDKVTGNELCGMPFPSGEYARQEWTVNGWTVGDDCPAALAAKFTGGTRLVVDENEANAGGTEGLECVVTYENAWKGLCGANEVAEYDGCTWSTAVFALPGSTNPSNAWDPAFVLHAGTVDEACAAKFCTIHPASVTHVSGAGL